MAQKISSIIKTILICYIATTIMLLVLALCLYLFKMSAWQVTAGIIVTYALSSFIGGYIMAKKQRNKKLLWGVGIGLIYFALLLVISLLMNKGVAINTTYAIRSVLVCVGAGAIGAFATPVQNM